MPLSVIELPISCGEPLRRATSRQGICGLIFIGMATWRACRTNSFAMGQSIQFGNDDSNCYIGQKQYSWKDLSSGGWCGIARRSRFRVVNLLSFAVGIRLKRQAYHDAPADA